MRPMERFSEHGFANALDITGFELENGDQVLVERDWIGDFAGSKGSSLQSNKPEQSKKVGEFLKHAHELACERFTTVLGPASDPHHSNHFHLDLGCHGKSCTYKNLRIS